VARGWHKARLTRPRRRNGLFIPAELMNGAAIAHYGFGTPVRALPISRYLEMPRETVRHMGRLVALGLFERAEDQTFVPSKELLELRSIGRCDCFARELRDYCEYRLSLRRRRRRGPHRSRHAQERGVSGALQTARLHLSGYP
jgi:hypothetical protein